MELSGTDEKILGGGSERQEHRTNCKRLQHASCVAIAGVIEQSNDQMGRPGNRGWHREDASEEPDVLGIVALGRSVGIVPKIMRTTRIQHSLANLAYQSFNRSGNVAGETVDTEQSQVE